MAKALPLSLVNRKNERPFFQHTQIPQPTSHYVIWLDVMGSQSAMRRSLPMSTNFVMKLHIACQQSLLNHKSTLELFPVIDGVYITCPEKAPILYFVKEVMSRLALTYIFEDDLRFRFMVRGALAFGPISKGSSFPATNSVFNINPNYTSHIVLGPALSQAYEDERKASPFGIYICESARMFAPFNEQPFQGVHHMWWRVGRSPADDELVVHLKEAIHIWFDWAMQHSSSLMYELSRMKEHRALFDEYYAGE